MQIFSSPAATASIVEPDRETQCINLGGILGVLKHPGGYGEYFKIPAHQLFHLPESVPFPEGAVLADAVVTSAHAVKRGRVREGETVVVISVGGCSAAAIQICKFYGARVICIVRSAEKQRRAVELGADETLNSREVDIPSAVKELTHGLGVQCVIDGVGSRDTLQEGITSLCHGGRLVILGYTQERHPLDPRRRCPRIRDYRDTIGRPAGHSRIDSVCVRPTVETDCH